MRHFLTLSMHSWQLKLCLHGSTIVFDGLVEQISHSKFKFELNPVRGPRPIIRLGLNGKYLYYSLVELLNWLPLHYCIRAVVNLNLTMTLSDLHLEQLVLGFEVHMMPKSLSDWRPCINSTVFRHSKKRSIDQSVHGTLKTNHIFSIEICTVWNQKLCDWNEIWIVRFWVFVMCLKITEICVATCDAKEPLPW